MRYIFGPVNSRRFGKSLGIDLSPDKKQCNFDCLYCELEKAKPVDKMENEPNPDEIVNEVKTYLKNSDYPDVITITANGEPTLYSKLSELIDKLNSIKEKSKLLILTNGSRIYRPEIRKALKKLDMVKISLDAVDSKTFKKVDKPSKNVDIEKIKEGIKEFRKIFNGELIIEIMLVRNINDTIEDIKNIGEYLKEINPDRVDIGTIDRPPAYRVKPISNEKLLELSKILEDYGLPVNTILRRDETDDLIYNSIEEIIEILKRRPLTMEEIKSSTQTDIYNQILELISKGVLKLKKIGDTEFLTISKIN